VRFGSFFSVSKTTDQLSKNMKTLEKQITASIEILPTFEQRMAAEGILELVIERAISKREAIRQLANNGITL